MGPFYKYIFVLHTHTRVCVCVQDEQKNKGNEREADLFISLRSDLCFLDTYGAAVIVE